MIGIVDYGMGNLLSVFNAFEYLGEDVEICASPVDLSKVSRIVLPGVGAFKDCIAKLQSEGFVDALNEEVIAKGKPTLGICLGMQVMARVSHEGGEYEGLGWFDAEVTRLHPEQKDMKVPNIGWNEVTHREGCPLFTNIRQQSDFYLVHSYYMDCNDANNVVATYPYGHTVTAAVLKDNVFATQFHPEKSQDFGLKVLENFVNWNP